ncbi:MAG TPA: 4Fe-4S dicluster domain-containing protein [Myxococcales bacterium]|jgi:Fe-S-cluster-containing dehydrogenase component
MTISRRGFLQLAGLTGAAAAVGSPGTALASTAGGVEPFGLLIDTTKCVGCRGCEIACSEQNGTKLEAAGDRSIFDHKRKTTTDQYMTVNRADAPGRDGQPRYVKTQCMHCLEPACASACLARALDKTPEGPVVYHPERCLGCRYCMMACPFELPRFEYDKAIPVIRKCQACHDRPGGPACAEACPSGTLQYGKRAELIEIAKERIYQNPDKYLHHVYGEHEAGGTSVLYLADVAFEKLGLKSPEKLGDRGYPELTSGVLGVLPFVMTLWPPLLMGIYTFAKEREEKVAAEKGADSREAKHE